MKDKSESDLKERMGLRYYLTPWLRDRERNRLKVIAAVELELEAEIKAKRETTARAEMDGKEEMDFVYEFTGN